MTIVDLKMLYTAGKFHHATYRQDGLWTGLWVYEKAADGTVTPAICPLMMTAIASRWKATCRS